jgi:hypothetical protein
VAFGCEALVDPGFPREHSTLPISPALMPRMPPGELPGAAASAPRMEFLRHRLSVAPYEDLPEPAPDAAPGTPLPREALAPPESPAILASPTFSSHLASPPSLSSVAAAAAGAPEPQSHEPHSDDGHSDAEHEAPTGDHVRRCSSRALLLVV